MCHKRSGISGVNSLYTIVDKKGNTMTEDSREESREELWEKNMIDSGVKRYYKGIARAKQKRNKDGVLVTIRDESNTSYGINMLRYYVQSIKDTIDSDIKAYKSKPGVTPVGWEYLANLNTETAAFIAAKTIINGISTVTKLTALGINIATRVEDNARFEAFDKYDNKYFRGSMRFIKEQKVTEYRQKKEILLQSSIKSGAYKEWKEWPIKHKMQIGIALLDAFIKATSEYSEGKRIRNSGLIEKYTQNSRGKTVYFIHGTAKAFEWIRANNMIAEGLLPDYMPCIAPPMDWVSPTEGGFHTKEMQRRKPLVKMQRKCYLHDMAKHIPDMRIFYDTVNALQSTAWEVNTIVYNQMLREFKRNDGIDMPRYDEYMIPPSPLPDFDKGSMTGKEFREFKIRAKKHLSPEKKSGYAQWHLNKRRIEAKERERVSKAMHISRTLTMARKLLYEEEIYFVWTADFRGRLYACGTALSPQGTEKSKALLRFKEGKELNKDGFEHLCIHACGCYGNDKIALSGRVSWILEHQREIVDTGIDPEMTRDFWKQADKPYSFLAVCLELAECIQLNTKEREEYVSFIPCAQDGSCNGIQHYSAMLCDPVGAKAVNLVDSVVPSDIYTNVSDRVTHWLEYAVKTTQVFNGSEWSYAMPIDTQIAELWLLHEVNRNCTKKPTMVIPYGGTKISCRDACMKYLIESDEKRLKLDGDYKNPFKGLDIPNDNTDPEVYAITYLHHLVWLALDEIVIAARVGMKFLKDITKVVVKDGVKGSRMEWSTPTGFRVYMDVKNTKSSSLETKLDGRLQLQFKEEIDKIDTYRMGTGIAPNFVHSLDSSHLQMAVTVARTLGITDFACIHDSFGTHAGNCTLLHSVIRSTFTELHRDSLLKRFYYEQLKRKPKLKKALPKPIDVRRGDFNLKNVLKSTYFFR